MTVFRRISTEQHAVGQVICSTMLPGLSVVRLPTAHPSLPSVSQRQAFSAMRTPCALPVPSVGDYFQRKCHWLTRKLALAWLRNHGCGFGWLRRSLCHRFLVHHHCLMTEATRRRDVRCIGTSVGLKALVNHLVQPSRPKWRRCWRLPFCRGLFSCASPCCFHLVARGRRRANGQSAVPNRKRRPIGNSCGESCHPSP